MASVFVLKIALFGKVKIAYNYPPPGAKKEKCLLNSKYLEPLGFLIKGQGPSYSFCGFSLT